MITKLLYVFRLVMLTQLHITHAISLVPTKCVSFFITPGYQLCSNSIALSLLLGSESHKSLISITNLRLIYVIA
jgi:hypothetical protein